MDSERIPVLFLKTKSSPNDGYEDHFAEHGYLPDFIPVLEHRFRDDTLEEIRQLIIGQAFTSSAESTSPSKKFGGIIFTSQRAVEAFTKVIEKLKEENLPSNELLPSTCPFYVVGPATARCLELLHLSCPIVGEESGNGDTLAQFILSHYNGLWSSNHTPNRKPPLLFLVGEQRRDIIPKTVQSPTLSHAEQIGIEELVVYGTSEMESFRTDFAATWSSNIRAGHLQQWVVVFSPSGCRAMFEVWGLLDPETGKVKSKRVQDRRGSVAAPESQPRTYIATIGPTTSDYLLSQFGFAPDVVAPQPTPEGLLDGIGHFMAEMDPKESS